MEVSNAPEIWVCSKCRVGLHFVETIENNGNVVPQGWVHARSVDSPHAPDPVRLADVPGGEIRTVCDICSTPDPMNLWFTSGSGGILALPGQGTIRVRDRDNAWLVCDGCEEIIVNDDLVALLKRCFTALKAKQPNGQLDTSQRALIADRVRVFMETRLGDSERRNF